MSATRPCQRMRLPGTGGRAGGLTFPEGIFLNGFAERTAIRSAGYEGPTSWFTGIAHVRRLRDRHGRRQLLAGDPAGRLDVLLARVAAGGRLRQRLDARHDALAAAGRADPSISVLQGTAGDRHARRSSGAERGRRDRARSRFNVYSDAACKTLASARRHGELAGGTAGPSSAVSSLAPGQILLAGQLRREPLGTRRPRARCGGEILTVLAPTTTSTIQTGGGVTGASIPVLRRHVA